MNHPYLRAYMAGIVVPTAFLLVAMTAFTLARFVFDVPVPIERVVVFPMALIPNLFGVWNMLYVGLRSRSPLSIGAHGALLPFVIIPLGLTLGSLLGVIQIDQDGVHAFQAVRLPYARGVFVLPVVVVVYYLVWKYIVGFLNDLVGLMRVDARNTMKSPISRREFVALSGGVVAGAALTARRHATTHRASRFRALKYRFRFLVCWNRSARTRPPTITRSSSAKSASRSCRDGTP